MGTFCPHFGLYFFTPDKVAVPTSPFIFYFINAFFRNFAAGPKQVILFFEDVIPDPFLDII
jgi:hypothetical protein